MKEQRNNPEYGWEQAKDWFSDVTEEELEKLEKSFYQYVQDTESRGGVPNDWGFYLWRNQKSLESCAKGKGNRFPDYVD